MPDYPVCRHCGQRIELINFALGPQWMHWPTPRGNYRTDQKYWRCLAATVAEPPDPDDAPVGRCPGDGCSYREPHRHGSDCDKSCKCHGIGAVTKPLRPTSVSSCDWGYCDRPAVAERLHHLTVSDGTVRKDWLPVCAWHAGFEDEPGDSAR